MRTALARITGDDFVTEVPVEWASLDGVQPRYLVKPADSQQVAAVLELAAREQWAVLPIGSGSAISIGNPPRRGDIWLSTARLNAFEEYEPADLTATVQSGCLLSDLNRVFGEHGQILPLDPPGASSRTIGGIVATAQTGTLRLGYGQPRDWILGLHIATPDGKLIRSGGKVVKNVAGYDLTRLFTGSYGTLGIITQVSLKVYPKPATEMTLVGGSDEIDRVWKTAERVMAKNVNPVSLEIVSENALRKVGLEGDLPDQCLCVRVAGEEADVRVQAMQMERIASELELSVRAPVPAQTASVFWQMVSDLPLGFPIVVRLNTVPSRLPRFLSMVADTLRNAAECVYFSASAGVGCATLMVENPCDATVMQALLPALSEIRLQVVSSGGSLILQKLPTGWKEHIDVWGPTGTAASLMKGMKQAFDPFGILNPGRFVEGI
ncbi:MAG TPA: FAD-binding oxidoreductase [Candidatus Latescibacteria bacterium]|nr:FAD-binding oxidoreductase [Candidatus Latescibacterota bacterium]